ncbi:MAG: RluA family pseudouridine synthase [Oscillospiraceae bacterium]
MKSQLQIYTDSEGITNMRCIKYLVEAEQNGKKIQDFLKSNHDYSSRTIVKLKQYNDGILLNGYHAKAIDHLHTGDCLEITLREREDKGGVSNIIRSNQAVQVVYDDDDLLIYNKPPFMPVHPSCGHIHDTLCNVFATYCDKQDIDLSFRPVNRLDRDTSGAVIVAKNRHSASRLAESCEKIYEAVVCGVPSPIIGTVNMPIKRAKEEEMLRIVHSDGQPAVTHYEVLEAVENYSFVRFKLETGRTHQIRVHMAAIGHPLLGDTMYGIPNGLINRQALHCARVKFIQPISGSIMQAACPLPQDILNAMIALDFNIKEL